MIAADLDRLAKAEYPLLVQQLRREFSEHANDAEDAVQDALLRLWDTVNSDASAQIQDPRRWLYRVARNRLIDLVRARKSHRIVGLEEERMTDTGNSADPPVRTLPDYTLVDDAQISDTAETEIASRHDALEYALTRVNSAHRDLLLEFYLRGKSYEELAASLGYSRAALGTTLLRARRSVLKHADEFLEKRKTESLRLVK